MRLVNPANFLVCIYIYIYICLYTYTYTYIRIYTDIYIYMYGYVYFDLFMRTFVVCQSSVCGMCACFVSMGMLSKRHVTN